MTWGNITGNTSTFVTANTSGSTAFTSGSGNYASIDTNGNAANSSVTAGPYAIPWFLTPIGNTGATIAMVLNKAVVFGFVLTFPLTTTQVTYFTPTADSSSSFKYDIGLYNSAGTLIVHVGSASAGVTGSTFSPNNTQFHSLAWSAGSTSLMPGKYYLAFTTSCTSSCSNIAGDGAGNGYTFFGSATGIGTTSNGALSSTISPGSDVYQFTTLPAVVVTP
jgi:hypothetical protein